MKYAKFAAVVLILYFLGYVLGPTINPMLVQEKEPENSLEVSVELKGGPTYKIDLAEYRDGNLPEMVKITKPANIPTLTGEGTKPLRKDDKVKLLNRKDNLLIVETMDGTAKGTIEPLSTDIYQLLAQKKYDDDLAAKLAGGSKLPMTPTPAPGPAPVSNPTMPTPAPIDSFVETPAPAPAPDPTIPVVEPTPVPTPPAPDPDPDPDPAGGGDLTDDEIVELMKKSVADGAVKEFKADQVKEWKAAEKETVDGTEYQTGLAGYMAATIFGLKPVQAKALIKDGKVDRWVYAKSGMEIQ